MDDARLKRRRYKRQIDYEIANSIVNLANNTGGNVVIILENLSGIHRLGVNAKEKRRFNQWSYRRLRDFIQDKSDPYDIPVRVVEPFNTSQVCSRCGEKDNIIRSSVYFKCHNFGYKQHADANAAVNIAKKFIGQ